MSESTAVEVDDRPEEIADDIRTSVCGGVGRITLDRPKAMNALTGPMVRRAHDALERWRGDDTVRVVVIDGSGERSLCAGGDIKMFHASALGDGTEARDFFHAEYQMNACIAGYPKPVVALMFGAVLGGGVGISAHASHRLVAEGSSVGMPEVGIGFVPDVGGTWLLGRAPGELGLYLALTGLPANAADAVYCGLADAAVPRGVQDSVRSAPDHESVLAIATAAIDATDRSGGELPDKQGWIDACFSAATAREIVNRLRTSGGAENVGPATTADLIATRSPEAVELSLLAIRRARRLPDLESALAMEYGIAATSVDRPDFAEGIRAQVIDRDRTPRWRPASLAAVDVDALDALITRSASTHFWEAR